MHGRSLQEKPLVSIVLPVYNGEKYLRESLDSILAQTMEDWELIAVDDCSKDATPQILADSQEIGGYDPEMFLLEDYDYWLRILIRYGRIGHIKKVLYRYRIHEGSLSATKEKERDEQEVRLMHKCLPDITYRLRHHPEIFRKYFLLGVQSGEWSEEEMALFRRHLPALVEEAGL